MTDEERKTLVVPAWCPICQGPMKGVSSNANFYKHGCCTSCYIQWVEDREERWQSGWRPTVEQIRDWEDGLYGGEEN